MNGERGPERPSSDPLEDGEAVLTVATSSCSAPQPLSRRESIFSHGRVCLLIPKGRLLAALFYRLATVVNSFPTGITNMKQKRKLHEVVSRVVCLALQHPDWSNRRIADHAQCDRRCVRRYRRLIQECGLSTEMLDGLDGRSIWAFFNRPNNLSRDAELFERLNQQHPLTSMAHRWRAYCDEQNAAGERAISQSHFRRRVREYEAIRRFLP